MPRINVSLNVDRAQAVRLQDLAEQCAITSEQMASAIAVLALSQYLGEKECPGEPPAQRFGQAGPNSQGPAPLIVSSDYILPSTGFLRLNDIVGAPTKGATPRPRIVPVSRSNWLAGVKSGIYPQPVKLGGRVTAWRVEDIRAFILAAKAT